MAANSERRVATSLIAPSRYMSEISQVSPHRLSPERILVYISPQRARVLEFRTSVSSIRGVPFERIACLRVSIPASAPSLKGSETKQPRHAVGWVGEIEVDPVYATAGAAS
jgi:hypothetical protein